MPRSPHTEIQQALGAYALDALEGEEREAIELHLPECPRCRSEVASHREVASLLAHAGTSAPTGLWDRISSSLEEAPPALRLLDSRAPRPVERRWLTSALVAAAIAALLATTAGVRVVRQEHRINSLAAAVRSESLRDAAFAAMADPSASRTVLKSPDAAMAVTLVTVKDGGAYLVQDNLAPLPVDRTYQLWALVGESKVSAAILGGDPGLTAFRVPGAVDGFAITEEASPGATAPTRTPVVVGFVRA